MVTRTLLMTQMMRPGIVMIPNPKPTPKLIPTCALILTPLHCFRSDLIRNQGLTTPGITAGNPSLILTPTPGCVFYGTPTPQYGGACDNCTFTNNSASSYGGDKVAPILSPQSYHHNPIAHGHCTLTANLTLTLNKASNAATVKAITAGQRKP